MNPRATAKAGQDGLDFALVLRDCLNCAIIVVDARKRVTSINPPGEQLLSLKATELVGQSPERLPAPIREVIGESFVAGIPIHDRPAILRDKQRGDIAVRIASLPIRGETGKTNGVVLVVNDVSPVQRWEASMRRLDRLHNLATLSAGMAHEVRNAFVAIKTFVDLLLEQNKDADLAEVVRQEMSRIETLLGQMRNFSRPTKPAFSTIHLHVVLEKSLLLIQHLLEAKQIQVTRSFAASPDRVHADPDQLEQAFINLFFNSLDAMKPGGKLNVRTDANPDAQKGAPMLRVIIQDDGEGIAPAHLDRLFDPFFTTKPGGTGLGLAVTQRIVQEHGGAISVQSGLKKGASFSILLPAGKS